jgi:hypothetical protein
MCGVRENTSVTKHLFPEDDEITPDVCELIHWRTWLSISLRDWVDNVFWWHNSVFTWTLDNLAMHLPYFDLFMD